MEIKEEFIYRIYKINLNKNEEGFATESGFNTMEQAKAYCARMNDKDNGCYYYWNLF